MQIFHQNRRFPKTMVVCAAVVLSLGTLFSVKSVSAADALNPIALVYYGWHSSTVDQRIVNAKPEILIANTPAGLWHGNTNSAYFQSRGIKVFSYLTANYDQYSLSQNYSLINAIAAEGTYGIFVDQANPTATSYNTQICAYAHSKGLKVILNPGMPYINAGLYSIADFILTDEHYQGRAPMAVEVGHLNQTIVVGFGDWTVQQAATYSNTAWAKGFRYTWHEQAEYTALPVWLEQYISLLTPPSNGVLPTTPVAQPPSSSGTISGTVASSPVSNGVVNEYNLNVKINSSSVVGVSAGQTIWLAASVTDFPSLRTVGSSVTGTLDKSLGWWVLKPVSGTPIVNQAPVLGVIGNKTVAINQKLEIRLAATDPEGNALIFSASGMPIGATFSSGLFSWTPTLSGTFQVTFSVTDGKLSDSETVMITVNPPAVAPSVTTGNTIATVVSAGISSGASGEYNFTIRITATTVTGLTAGQTLWVAAKTSSFPNLSTIGSTLTGNLDKSLGWWVFKAAS
jgi:hypothetical protein